MEVERTKRRKCGPRVKTGCITCRIRRVKCDEAKPNCQRCVSTGRKCDGYVVPQTANSNQSQLRPNDGSLEVIRRPAMPVTAPIETTDGQRTRQLFHFYCVQSAFDLSVYLNSGFWHDMILQYSHYHPVVRQAVIAFGSSHMHALSINQNQDASAASSGALEQVRHYDRAIRSLREYISTDSRPDPHVILICCALFFSCENSRGNREAAWQHLENGLHILSSVEGNKSRKLLKSDSEVTGELELVATKNGAKLKAKTAKVDIDDELVYVFSRLDVQATLCKETRKPVLNLSELSQSATNESLAQAKTFATITEAQRSLDYLHNRLARFLSTAAVSQPPDSSPFTPEPDWLENERQVLNVLCESWGKCMTSFINDQQLAVRQNLQSKRAPKLSDSPDWQLALQIQLLNLHHRCWWMLFRSYHNRSVFTASPNYRASEILDICEFLGFALPPRPSAVYSMTEIDIAWKMVSEIGVTAPLFVLATKCTDDVTRKRAIDLLIDLRNYGNSMYHESFLDQLIRSIVTSPDQEQHVGSSLSSGDSTIPDSLSYRLQQTMTTPKSERDYTLDDLLHGDLTPYGDTCITEQDPGGLLGWSKSSPPA